MHLNQESLPPLQRSGCFTSLNALMMAHNMALYSMRVDVPFLLMDANSNTLDYNSRLLVC